MLLPLLSAPKQQKERACSSGQPNKAKKQAVSSQSHLSQRLNRRELRSVSIGPGAGLIRKVSVLGAFQADLATIRIK